MKKTLVWVGILMFLGCGEQTQTGEEISLNKIELFDILGPKETGIDFINYLKEGERMNGLFYEYFYNGGGVAVGDFNNDGKPDIYFTSNLQSNRMYLNEGNMKYKDVTKSAGVKGKYGFSTGTTLVDINQDDWLDIYVCKSGQFNDPDKRRNELWVNHGLNENGIPVFSEEAATFGLDCPQFSTQAAFFDYDRDNDLDMFLINHGIKTFEGNRVAELALEQADLRGERLFENRNGFYHDVTESAKIINNNLGYCLGLGIGDLNNDQWPDIYVSVDYSGKDHLYLNQGNGTFEESIIASTGHISNFSMGNDIADFNNDGKADIMVVDMASESYYDIKTSMGGMNPKKFFELVDLDQHHQYMYNTLQMNRGVDQITGLPQFSEIAQMSGVASSDWSWAPLIFDMDNDGKKDLFVSNGIKRDFRNNDFVIYRKEQDEKVKKLIHDGKKWDIKNYVDDLLKRMPTRKKPNNFYLNNGNLHFEKLDGIGNEKASFASNGAAYADFDGDGDLDLVINNSDDPAIIYRNNSELANNNYLKITFKGPNGNVNGLGAKVEIQIGSEIQMIEQYVSRGFQSSVDYTRHFGLGQAEIIDKLTIIWPDGNRQELLEIAANQTIALEYSASILFKGKNKIEKPLFQEVTRETLVYQHQENDFNDFERESLLPHRMSQMGPALAIADVNGDELDDVYVGGALNQSGQIFIQKEDGSFIQSSNKPWSSDLKSEDVGALFFDADNDGDQDLYVVSGGNEYENDSDLYKDRLYLNDGLGGFFKHDQSQVNNISGSCVAAFDYDEDGDLDLLIGGRQVPGQYPLPSSSLLLRNDSKDSKVAFIEVTDEIAPSMRSVGMVTDIVTGDFNLDNKQDILLVGEWMNPTLLIQKNGKFEDESESFGLSKEKGWWFQTAVFDFDQDGDLDVIAGNLGTNYKYHASKEDPFEVYASDFDGSGTLDIVLGYQKKGRQYPLRGRECSSNQMPFIKEKFPTYDAFGKASLVDVYGSIPLENALHYQANNFHTSYFENINGEYFKVKTMPLEVQVSVINSIEMVDLNEDGHMDVLLAGNMHVSEVETVRSDAGMGTALYGDGKGNFKPIEPEKLGVFLNKDVRAVKIISLGKESTQGLIVANNDDFVQVLKKNRLK